VQVLTRVRCYAGASYPERPTAFEWQGAWIEVIEVLWQARTPDGLVFDGLAEDGRRYRLEWEEVKDEWTVQAVP